MSTRMVALILGALVTALIVVGCGGGGDEETVSKAELIKRADADCNEGSKQSQAEFTAYLKDNKIGKNAEPTSAQFAEIVKEIQIPTIRQQTRAIFTLGAPSGDEEQIEAMQVAIEEAIDRADDDPEKAVLEADKLLAKVNRLLRAYGFKDCGS